MPTWTICRQAQELRVNVCKGEKGRPRDLRQELHEEGSEGGIEEEKEVPLRTIPSQHRPDRRLVAGSSEVRELGGGINAADPPNFLPRDDFRRNQLSRRTVAPAPARPFCRPQRPRRQFSIIGLRRACFRGWFSP